MGAPELIILIFIVAFGYAGYNMGKGRKIGATTGCVLGVFLSFLGLIIISFSDRIEQNYIVVESVTDQLMKYKQLLDSGAITESEYNIQKSKLLDQ